MAVEKEEEGLHNIAGKRQEHQLVQVLAGWEQRMLVEGLGCRRVEVRLGKWY